MDTAVATPPIAQSLSFMAEQEYMQPTLSYMICATPRSGSTLLCKALQNTGLAGKPDEYFAKAGIELDIDQTTTISRTNKFK